MNNVTTSLFCKNGKKLPSWFVLAYRAHRIPHEIADIVTQEYFISPPQVEEKSFDSAYLFIEPIVKAVYTMLWKSSQTSNWDQNHSSCNSVALNESSMSQSCGLEDAWTASKNYDSDDVVVEEDSEESLYDKDEGSNEESQLLNKKEINEIVVNNEEMQEKCNNSEMIGENKYLGIIDLESVKAFEKEKPDRSIAVLVNNNTENIQKKKKKRRKSNKKSACNDKGIESEKKEVTQKEEELLYPLAGPEEREEEVDLLDNRFASLIL
ncbi:hypothetical protein E2C01_057705 [Portunus trituberculatus]|uniref:Uncharacterized protein n=1 Tax=Portunus trituberculatus TaxID=210409 RepID=A0A5B7H178_PORTR|nr:hypothetical protein [Portunus trituberculatus]